MAHFKLFGTYEDPKTTNRFLLAAYKAKAKILCIEVDTRYPVVSIHFLKGSHPTVNVDIEISKFGISSSYIENKTPLGTFFPSGERLKKGKMRMTIAPDKHTPVFGRTNKHSNLGAAFIGFDAMDTKGCYRGIGFHGSEKNKLTKTEGCIRMYNDDVLILAKMICDQTNFAPPIIIHNF